VPGHWEGDLILGAGHGSAIGTLVERSTRFTILLHLPGDHTADTVAAAMIEAMRELPDHLRRSITWDRGSEMANWKQIHLDLDTPVYFCDPHSPWQRGSNENTYWWTVLGPDGFDGSHSGGLLGDSENTCRTWLSVDLSTAA
jgi:IS30 family transposase